MTDPLVRLASRKFLVTVLVIAIATVLNVIEMLTPLWVECVTWLVGLYITGNVVAPVAYRFTVGPASPAVTEK